LRRLPTSWPTHTRAALGVAAGVARAVLVGRSLATLLFEVSAADPPVLAASALLLLAMAAAASWRRDAPEPSTCGSKESTVR
jgi:hypothetical protein